MDLPVMDQEEVGNTVKPFPGLVIAVCDRLVGDVAARHDQGNKIVL